MKDVMPVKKIVRKRQSVDQQKLFILDTNVLLHDPHALESFEGVHVSVPVIVLEELDRFKHEGTDRGRNAREVIRILDRLRAHGSLKDGVALSHGGKVSILFSSSMDKNAALLEDNNDNGIIKIAYTCQQQGYAVTFISKDLNARVKADALGIRTEDYQKETVSPEEFYHGWVKVPVSANELRAELPGVLNDLYKGLAYNEFVLLESQHNPHNYRLFRYLGNKNFKTVTDVPMRWPLRAKNPEQLMALDLLFDPAVQCITLFGPAGTGKTFLVLLAGLYKVLVEHEFERMLVSRPVIPLGRDLGYLPGTLEEKLYSWMLPIYDNIQFIVHSTKMDIHGAGTNGHEHVVSSKKLKERHQDRSKHKGSFGNDEHSVAEKKDGMTLENLIKQNKISLEPITYMRGRSIPYQLIFVDEVQNLTPHEVKTLVTRVGQGSKIVLAGDPYQIDSPYLDFASNGLVAASERLKGQRLFGSVFLQTSERSELSEMASKLL